MAARLAALLASITLATRQSQVRDRCRNRAYIPSATSTVVFWITAALLAGPPLGIAAAWTRSSSQWRIGAGYGVVAGVLIGEAVYGLTQIRDTTEPVYWVLAASCGVAVIVFVAARHPHLSSVASTLAVASAAAVVVHLAAISA